MQNAGIMKLIHIVEGKNSEFQGVYTSKFTILKVEIYIL